MKDLDFQVAPQPRTGELKSAPISSPEGNLQLNTLRYGKYFYFPDISADLRSAGIPYLCFVSLQGWFSSFSPRLVDELGLSRMFFTLKILILNKPCAG